MEYLLEIMKLIEASLQSDRRKAMAYTSQLMDKLERSGEKKAADSIRRVLSNSQSVVLPSSINVTDHSPVDSESRLSLADIRTINPDEIELFFATGRK